MLCTEFFYVLTNQNLATGKTTTSLATKP